MAHIHELPLKCMKTVNIHVILVSLHSINTRLDSYVGTGVNYVILAYNIENYEMSAKYIKSIIAKNLHA